MVHELNFIEELQQVIKQYYDRVLECESQKWDLEFEVRRRDYEVHYPFGFYI